jgi:DNA-binding MarR family transcriptional regulator
MSDYIEVPAVEFERLVLQSFRLTEMVRQSTILAEQSLNLRAFSLLVATESQPGGLAYQLGNKASIFDRAGQRQARDELCAAGLIEEGESPRGVTLKLTESGERTLAAVRQRFAEVANAAEVKSWRAVPRAASLIRSLRAGLQPDEATKAA